MMFDASRVLAGVGMIGLAMLLATDVAAQQKKPAQSEGPLSVIDWLGTQSQAPRPPRPRAATLAEPPVTKDGTPPQVSVTPLGAGSPREIGLVPPSVTGLPATLWSGSDGAEIAILIEALDDPRLPAAQSLLYTVLLAEAQAPGGNGPAGDALALVRVRKLMDQGALDPALSLIEQAGVTVSPAHFDLWMQISLLTGTEDRACSTLTRSPHLSRDYGNRIFCAARNGQWDIAALTLGSAQALELENADRLALLDRFLNPDTFDDADPLPTLRVMDPLSFRLFETIGESLPTRNLPRAYAVADLRDVAGWKSQLEAAERLTRAGALPDNSLLGLYTDRKPAASGGIWDRVAALQRFETALNTGSAEAVTKTLPAVWDAMQEAELEVSFAALFADRLGAVALSGKAAAIAFEVALLSPGYEAAVAGRTSSATDQQLLIAVARGEAAEVRPEDAIPAAVFDAFAAPTPRDALVAAARADQLGLAILRVLDLLDDGTDGDTTGLRDALSTLRALGLEDTARRAALQILLLKR